MHRNLPRSIIIGIPLVTLCYALINISYLTAMSPDEMVDSEAVAVTFGNRILGPLTWLMPLSVTISTFGSANGTLFAAGRYVTIVVSALFPVKNIFTFSGSALLPAAKVTC